jgi:hypothetical protein
VFQSSKLEERSGQGSTPILRGRERTTSASERCTLGSAKGAAPEHADSKIYA